ncbi:hypothetical protein [Sphingomonas baiyangensis]|uniref:Uncharacterized protein n=1 Tax=Sphingomonas baiyangensis TaxID=2572576 RepID=A0A4V5PTJ0_9SPHN|nr:hypothetical protein [Sphingomonas baiyangensis]TKD50238.1 hypothetical protein FBR43_05305 [Sphingomonas baiyangensis]
MSIIYNEWLPIADAPKDGTIIDLWTPDAEHPSGGRRATNFCWCGSFWTHPVMFDGAYGFPYLNADEPTHYMIVAKPENNGFAYAEFKDGVYKMYHAKRTPAHPDKWTRPVAPANLYAEPPEKAVVFPLEGGDDV